MNIIRIIIIIIINIQSGPPGFLRNGSAPRQILLHQIGCPVGFTFWICSFDKLIRDAGRGELDDGWKFFQDVFAENSNQWSYEVSEIIKFWNSPPWIFMNVTWPFPNLVIQNLCVCVLELPISVAIKHSKSVLKLRSQETFEDLQDSSTPFRQIYQLVNLDVVWCIFFGATQSLANVFCYLPPDAWDTKNHGPHICSMGLVHLLPIWWIFVG